MRGYTAKRQDIDGREIDERERLRVARIIIADEQFLADELAALKDGDGVRERSRPTEIVAARRRAVSNGMPETETVDTIGKMWAWGLLDGSRFSSDLLRDAGRRYAASYWWQWGQVCAHGGSYGEMSGRSSGPPRIVIADPEKDEIADARFRRRDDAIRSLKNGRKVKDIVDQVCVDGAGDNDPSWLCSLMAGYPSETRTLRVHLEMKQIIADAAPSKDERRKAQRNADDARRALDRRIRELRRDLLPHALIDILIDGLTELCAIDQSEGLHKPKRGTKIQCDD